METGVLRRSIPQDTACPCSQEHRVTLACVYTHQRDVGQTKLLLSRNPRP
jgi:hypothetical protein